MVYIHLILFISYKPIPNHSIGCDITHLTHSINIRLWQHTSFWFDYTYFIELEIGRYRFMTTSSIWSSPATRFNSKTKKFCSAFIYNAPQRNWYHNNPRVDAGKCKIMFVCTMKIEGNCVYGCESAEFGVLHHRQVVSGTHVLGVCVLWFYTTRYMR